MDYLDVMGTQKAAVETKKDHHAHRASVTAVRPDYKPYGTVFGWKQNTTWRSKSGTDEQSVHKPAS